MVRKYLMAGMALAVLTVPALSVSTSAYAHDRRPSIRHYIVQNDNGTCSVSLYQRGKVLGHYRSRAGADRALRLKSECAPA